jgi:hypothetical protein
LAHGALRFDLLGPASRGALIGGLARKNRG